MLRALISATSLSLMMLTALPQASALPFAREQNRRMTPAFKEQSRYETIRAKAQMQKPFKVMQKRMTQKTMKRNFTPRPRIQTAAVMARLPKHERATVIKMLRSSRVRSSVQTRRAVAAFMLLRGLKDGHRLPLTAKEMANMTTSKRWTAKRMGNFALVLREAVRIAQKEKIGAKEAFNKALKKFGVYKKYYSGVCGV